jgi:hypothetical protein
MLTAAQVAENYFLESRHMLLEVAAHFDRYDAARGRENASPGAASHANGHASAADAAARKLAVLREALAIVADPAPRQERTVSLLELFAKA